MALLRSCLFYFCIYFTVLFHGIFGLTLALLLPFKARFYIITSWNRLTLWLLKVVCGVRSEVIGRENIPEGNFVILSNHESTWETVILQPLFAPLSTILKRELLRIPFFGWALAALEPIAIDRGNPRDAMRKVLDGGLDRITKGRNVLVFPEGSRKPEKKSKKYARSGAGIAIKAGVPVLPIAHNAADHWPGGKITKIPGTITLSIGQPIDTTDSDSRTVTETAQAWIEGERLRLTKTMDT